MKNIQPQILDATVNIIGESPLWHPLRNTLYWLDFPNKTLFSYHLQQCVKTQLDEMATAVAWIDHEHLLLATVTGLYKYHIENKNKELIINIEHDIETNRSNDGRADPWGGFWVGTMDVDAAPHKGAFYRWYKGELRTIVSNLSIPNGVCFDKHRLRAYFSDSTAQKVYTLELNEKTGWPESSPRIFYDFSDTDVSPDGAVVDTQGNIWIALWDGSSIACLSPEGELLYSLDTQTNRPTCPAFGGTDASTLFVTTASHELANTPVKSVAHGVTLQFTDVHQGSFEPAVKV